MQAYIASLPRIDNHAHPIGVDFSKYPLVAAVAGLADSESAMNEAVTSLAYRRALKLLSGKIGVPGTDEAIRGKQKELGDLEYSRQLLAGGSIKQALLDDGIYGQNHFIEWHDSIFPLPTKRIFRIERLAEQIITDLALSRFASGSLSPDPLELLHEFNVAYLSGLDPPAPGVVCYKSVIAYRSNTGLRVDPHPASDAEIAEGVVKYFQIALDRLAKGDKPTPLYTAQGGGPFLRIAHKALNDYLLQIACKKASELGLPIQIHTGLGDADVDLEHSNPLLLRSLIAAFPRTQFVLLHSSWPYSRQAGFLAHVYGNVWCDVGLNLRVLSQQGGRRSLEEVLELCPTSKVLWSTDSAHFPEGFFVGTQFSDGALASVLDNIVLAGELSEEEAKDVAKDILYRNAWRLYKLTDGTWD